MPTPATSPRLPLWRRLRLALADVEAGLYPSRALSYHRIPKHWHDDPRIASLLQYAETNCQRQALLAIASATTKGEEQRQLPDVEPGASARGRLARARVTARTWSSKDWRAPAWLLERRFPQEYGQAQPVDVGSQVAMVIDAMASLRASVSGQPAQGLPRGLVARAALPEGGGTP